MKVVAVLLSLAVAAIGVGLVLTLRRPVVTPDVGRPHPPPPQPPVAQAPSRPAALPSPSPSPSGPAAPAAPTPSPPSGAPASLAAQQQVERFLLPLETRAVIAKTVSPDDLQRGIEAIRQQSPQLGPQLTEELIADFRRHLEEGAAGRTGAKRMVRMMREASGADRDAISEALRSSPR